jgi:small subunit ribosomal protein S8
MNDPIADMLTRIQNAIMRKRDTVEVLNTKMSAEILEVLKQEEMIEDFEEKERYIEVSLMYNEDGEPEIFHLEKVSKPGQRIYVSANDIVPILNGRGISVISTSQGIMNGALAKSQNLGGEFICKIW